MNLEYLSKNELKLLHEALNYLLNKTGFMILQDDDEKELYNELNTKIGDAYNAKLQSND